MAELDLRDVYLSLLNRYLAKRTEKKRLLELIELGMQLRATKESTFKHGSPKTRVFWPLVAKF
jgi:hypothetical protein